MADNVAITAGAGTTVGTDERTINGTAVHVQRVDEQGSTAIATGRVNVTTTSGSAVAARDTRKSVTVRAHPDNTDTIDVGPSGVASGSGFLLQPGDAHTFQSTAAIHADAASGTQVLIYAEEYDS